MALTEAVSDFIDADADKRMNGAEADDYRYADFPYLPANRSLASVSELRAVKGMTSEVYEALRPWVTVWPETGAKINYSHRASTCFEKLETLTTNGNRCPSLSLSG